MSFRAYKFLVVPVIQEVDDEGNVTGELTPDQPVPVFGISGLHAFADNFEDELLQRVAEAQQQQGQVVIPNGAGKIVVPGAGAVPK
jgi:hypothetical protein